MFKPITTARCQVMMRGIACTIEGVDGGELTLNLKPALSRSDNIGPADNQAGGFSTWGLEYGENPFGGL